MKKVNKENNRIEYKRELNDSLEKTVVGFLNYQEGGFIYIGVDDDGISVGVDHLDSVQLKIADRLKNNILPSPLGLFDIIVESYQEKEVIKIVVSSGPDKPYYIKKYGMSPNGCFIRLGSSVQPMTVSLIEKIFANRSRKSLHSIVSPRQELSFAQLKIYYQENNLELNKMFPQSLELLTPEGEYNYTAYLLADENNISMKVVKYQGKDKVDLIENSEYGYCSLIKAANNILNKLEIENKVYAKITDKKREERSLVDKVALREALINAIVHNDWSNEIPPLVEIFSDRLVITSSGGLPQSLTQEEFFSGCSAPRNKELMRVLKDLKLVEQIGSGMLRILKVYDKSSFKISENFIKIEFIFDNVTENVTDNVTENVTEKKRSQEVVDLMGKNKLISIDKIAEKLAVSRRTILRDIEQLKEKGLIKRIGPDKGGYWEIVE